MLVVELVDVVVLEVVVVAAPPEPAPPAGVVVTFPPQPRRTSEPTASTLMRRSYASHGPDAVAIHGLCGAAEEEASTARGCARRPLGCDHRAAGGVGTASEDPPHVGHPPPEASGKRLSWTS